MPGRDVTDSAPAGGGRDGHGRRADRRLRRQVRLQLLAPDHGHSQRRGDARDPGWTPFIETPMHPGIRAPIASCQGLWAPCSRPRSAPGRCRSWLGQLDGRGLPRARGPASAISCRRSRSRASTMGCTTQLDGGRHRDGKEGRRARGDEVAQDAPLTSPRWRVAWRSGSGRGARLPGRPRSWSDARPADDH